MTDTSLTISFKREDEEDDYWAILQEAEDHSDDQAVSYSDAASVIDDIFEIEPCTLNETAIAVTGGEANEVDTSDFDSYQEAITEAFIKILPSNYFGKEGHEFSAVVEVYLSDPDKPYKLNLNNGTILNTKRVERKVYESKVLNSDDDGEMSVTYPIITEPSCDDYEIESYTTNKIVFADADAVTNEIIEIEYFTTYDEVTIQVHEQNDTFGECLCFLFYQKTVETLTLSYTETDDLISSAISSASQVSEAIPTPIDYDCYLRKLNFTTCRCFPYYDQDIQDELIEVSCDTPGSSIYPGGADAIIVTGFVACEGEDWEGADDDFYYDNCCEEAGEGRTLPTCTRYKEMDYGGKEIIKGFDFYINNALTNEVVAFSPVGPKDGICGEITTIMEVNPLPCCGDESYVPLEIDWAESADTIAPGSYAYVYWTGGRDTATLTISGVGFYFDEDLSATSITIEGRGCAIYSNYDSCGTANITIDDGCTTATAGLAGTDGQWSHAAYTEPDEEGYWGDVFDDFEEEVGGEVVYEGTVASTSTQRLVQTYEVSDEGSEYYDIDRSGYIDTWTWEGYIYPEYDGDHFLMFCDWSEDYFPDYPDDIWEAKTICVEWDYDPDPVCVKYETIYNEDVWCWHWEDNCTLVPDVGYTDCSPETIEYKSFKRLYSGRTIDLSDTAYDRGYWWEWPADSGNFIWRENKATIVNEFLFYVEHFIDGVQTTEPRWDYDLNDWVYVPIRYWYVVYYNRGYRETWEC